MGLTFEEQQEKAKRTLAMMLDYLGLEGTIRAEEKNRNVALIVTSEEDSGRIIGRKGQTLDNLQLLSNRIMQKNSRDNARVYIDIDGYFRKDHVTKDKRFDSEEEKENIKMLEQKASDAAKEVKKWGEEVALPVMNAHDRRIVHMQLENDTDITTESLGEGNLKKIIIKPV